VFVAGHLVDDAIDPVGITRCLEEGATVFVHAVHHHRGALAGLCGAVGRQVQAPVIPHLVMTPPGSKGLAIHADREHVVVVQLTGTKTWEVFRSPGLRQPGRNRIRLDDEVTGELPDRFELAPGDVLSIPSGTPHHAWTSGSSGSIHVSLTMLLPTWAFLGEAMMRRVISAIDGVPRQEADVSTDAWLQRIGEALAGEETDEIVARYQQARRSGTPWTDLAVDLDGLLDLKEGMRWDTTRS
jgi:ribosomal protein L16 Arg81 hydroxylase